MPIKRQLFLSKTVTEFLAQQAQYGTACPDAAERKLRNAVRHVSSVSFRYAKDLNSGVQTELPTISTEGTTRTPQLACFTVHYMETLSEAQACSAVRIGPVMRNSQTPLKMAMARAQSMHVKCFPLTAMPQTMTDIILKLSPKIWTGKLTYFSISYWQALAETLNTDTATYLHKGATYLILSPCRRAVITAKTKATMRSIKKTRKTEELNLSPPYSQDIFSCRTP